MPVLNMFDMVSPWNCHHLVHKHCLQVQVQHSSTTTCPSCNENITNQLMPLPSTSNVLNNSNNMQEQEWLNLQCACGFRSAIVGIGNKNAAIFCPNCHQLMNVNSQTMDMPSDQSLTSMNVNQMAIKMQSMNLPYAYPEPEREILERSNSLDIHQRERFFSAQDFRFGWPTQSFNGFSR